MGALAECAREVRRRAAGMATVYTLGSPRIQISVLLASCVYKTFSGRICDGDWWRAVPAE